METKKDFFGAFKGIGPFTKEDKATGQLEKLEMREEAKFIKKTKKRSLEPVVKKIKKSGFGISKGLASFTKEDKTL